MWLGSAMLFLVACSGTTGVVETTTAKVTLSDLVGSWENELAVLQVGDDGSYLVFLDPHLPDLLAMVGFVARDGDEFDFVTGTQGECPGQTGVYRVDIDDNMLTLSQVDDPCEWRQSVFSAPFKRREQ